MKRNLFFSHSKQHAEVESLYRNNSPKMKIHFAACAELGWAAGTDTDTDNPDHQSSKGLHHNVGN